MPKLRQSTIAKMENEKQSNIRVGAAASHPGGLNPGSIEESGMTLIERLEAAENGSRELDQLIARNIGAGAALYSDNSGIDRALDYTTSLDAALTLVPKGMTFGMGWDTEIAGPYAFTGKTGEERKGYYARTPALALCIAALKARQTQEASGQIA